MVYERHFIDAYFTSEINDATQCGRFASAGLSMS
jgi:hypothetical protein